MGDTSFSISSPDNHISDELDEDDRDSDFVEASSWVHEALSYLKRGVVMRKYFLPKQKTKWKSISYHHHHHPTSAFTHGGAQPSSWLVHSRPPLQNQTPFEPKSRYVTRSRGLFGCINSVMGKKIKATQYWIKKHCRHFHSILPLVLKLAVFIKRMMIIDSLYDFDEYLHFVFFYTNSTIVIKFICSRRSSSSNYFELWK